MSWLNNSLSTLKGQLTNLAQEVLAETAGPGDADYQGPAGGRDERAQTALELLAETQQQKEQLDRRCEEKDREIAALRREIAKKNNKEQSKPSTYPKDAQLQSEEQNVEDTWCWEPDGGGGGDPAKDKKEEEPAEPAGLVEIALGANDVSRLSNRIAELEQLNAQLNASLEELDSQHELAMRDVLEHKTQLAGQMAGLKQMQADRMVEHELASARQQKQLEEVQRVARAAEEGQEELQQRVEQQAAELKRGVLELAEMQELLEKRSQDSAELIDRVRLAEAEREQLAKELEELGRQVAKEKKTSESSSNSSSTGKHSEDEFIVVARQADAACASGSGSDPDPDPDLDVVTSPPSKEKLRDRLVSLESQISQLTLANQQLQDGQLEKQLSVNLLGEQLAELEKRLRLSEAEKEQLQLDLQLRLQQLTVQNQELKLHAEAEQEGHAQDLEEQLGALRAENRRLRQELDASIAQAKFRQAIAEEKQEITDLDEADAATEYGHYELDKLRGLLQAEIEDRLGSATSQQKLERAWNSLSERWHRLDVVEQRLLEVQNQQLICEHEKKTLEADISQYILQCEELMKNNELLLLELDKFKRNKLETIEEHHEETIMQLEAQLEEARQRLELALGSQRDLESRLRLAQREQDSAGEVDLLAKIEQREAEKLQLEQQLSSAKKELAEKAENQSQEQGQLQQRLQQSERSEETLRQKLASLTQQLDERSQQLRSSEDRHESQLEQLSEVSQRLEDKSSQLRASEDQHKAQLAKMQAQLQADQERLRELLQAQDKLEQQKELMEVDQNQQLSTINKELAEATRQLDECQEQLALKEVQLAEVQQELREINEEKTGLQQQLLQASSSESPVQLQELRDQLQQTQAKLARRQEELLAKSEELQLKESHLAAKETAEQAADQSHQQLQQAIESLGQEKNELIRALQQKHLENTQYYAEIQRLQPCEAQLQEVGKEREKLVDQIAFLKEKSDILTTNLLTEQTNQRLLQQQQAESLEQQGSVQRDLERLRAHLLEIEELHTQETVELQQELQESRARQAVLEQEASKSSTAYTSASIRANQQAETLQAQHALLQQQRDELLAKLGQCEDRELKQQAALTNLQCALEQFQNDKDHDIELATQRIRREMQSQLDRQGQLQAEMVALQQQLADANQGLRAAARLSDQLEAGQQTIAVLRDEVESLKEANARLEQSLSSSESSQTDRIDKSLIKSLLIGYVVSGHAGDKQQVLRMISSVLDFSAQEADKVGLNKQQSSWLGAILGGNGSPSAAASATGSVHGKDNLVQAFVQFLEQESQPQNQVASRPTLLSMSAAGQMDTSSSGNTLPMQTAQISHTSVAAASSQELAAEGIPATPPAGGSGGSPQSLAMGSNEFAPSRNSSSILKDILSDS